MVLSQHSYQHWYIGGHSLGGTIAARYASGHDQMEAVIMLASYSIDQLDEKTLAILIYGSLDGVLNREKYQKGKDFVPDYLEHVIEGGNHAGFGSYGKQKKDNDAQISSEDQIRETVEVIVQALGLK